MDTTEELGTNSAKVVGLVAQDDLMSCWPQIREVLLANGRHLLNLYTDDDVLLFLLKEHWQCWVGADGGEIELVAFCRNEQYRDSAVYRIVYVGGKWKKYMPESLEVLERFAAMGGATHLAWDGRKGWIGRMQAHGYQVTSYEMRKPIAIRWRN